MDSEISAHQLKRFVKHLCIVARRYYEKESARRNLDMHLVKIKKSDNVEKEMSALNKKINILLEKESKVAELGIKKSPSSEIKRRIVLLEQQLELAQIERDELTDENESLKKAIDSMSSLKSTLNDYDEVTKSNEKKVQRIEETVDKKYRNTIINGLKEKISLLESNYKAISKDKSISPNRLFNIEKRIHEYKETLKSLNIS